MITFDLDARLRDLARSLHLDLQERLVHLLDHVTTTADDVAEAEARAQRAEDLAHECRRQLRASHRHADRLAAAIDRIRRLHPEHDGPPLADGKWCPGCGEERPCPTYLALADKLADHRYPGPRKEAVR